MEKSNKNHGERALKERVQQQLAMRDMRVVVCGVRSVCSDCSVVVNVVDKNCGWRV